MSADPFPLHIDTAGPHAGIATLRLEQPGKSVVVLDLPLVQRLEATLRSLPAAMTGVTGLVLASASERVFVAGADLKSIHELSDDQLHRYLKYTADVFGLLSQLRCPTVAAINGAALGGGLELAMHCDGLVAAPSPSGKPYQVGLPEAGLGICPGWGGTNLLPARMNPLEAIRRTATGETMSVDQAQAAGLFDAFAATPQDLLATAKAWLAQEQQRWKTGRRPERDGAPSRWIGRPGAASKVLSALEQARRDLGDTEPTRAVLDAVDTGLIRGWAAGLEAERKHLVRLRNTPSARAAIEAFFAKAAAPKR